jgi:Zn-dependent protease with chaperone function
MNPSVDAALRSLPAWAGWSFVGVEVAAAIGLSLIATSAGAAVALGPLRALDKARGDANSNSNKNSNEIAHSTAAGGDHGEGSPAGADHLPAPLTDPTYAERARLAYPPRAFTAYNALLVPAVLAAFGALAGGGHLSRVPAPLAAAIAWIAALVVTLRGRLLIEREARRIHLPALRWLRGAFTLWIIMMPHLFVALAVSIAMPFEIGLEAALYLAGGAALIVYLAMGGTVAILRLLGLARPASARIASIVASVAEKTGVRTRGAFELVLPWANAYALPLSGRIGFTDEAIRNLRDDELAAVCAHELGHLSEGRRTLAVRLFALFALYFPIALAKPLLVGGNPGRFAAAMLGAYASLILVRRFFRRMEVRADKAARHHEGDEGTYARALARIHEVNAMPVVLHNHAGVHPDLYDRLAASGAAPSYPRPKPPPRLRALGALGVAVAAALAGSIAIHSGLRAAAGAIAGSSDAGAIGIASAIGDARSIGQLGRRFDSQGDAEAAAAMYRLAAEVDDRSIEYPARLAIGLAGAGRCEEAGSAAADAQDRMMFYGLDDTDGVIAEADRALKECLGRRPGPTN